MNTHTLSRTTIVGLALASIAPRLLAQTPPAPAAPAAPAQDAQPGKEPPRMSSEARLVEQGDVSGFRNDPTWPFEFSYDEQRRTYAKAPVITQRPLLEWGRELYREGPLLPGLTWFGEKNPLFPGFMLYGDWRTAAGFSDNGKNERAKVATRLNLDVNLQITATERLHAFFQPLDKNNRFTGFDLGGDDRNASDDGVHLDGNPETLYFEGDLGAIAMGATGHENHLDLPFTFGKIPLLFQNGVWVEDAFVGGAVTIPAHNSPMFGISNFDVTFFAGFDDVTNPGLAAAGARESHTHLFGVTTFMDVQKGYVEAGYGYTDAENDASYHNLTASFTRRYADWLSNSVRVIWNFGQDLPGKDETADGVLLLVENSFRSRAPYTLIPYLNLFAGFGSPQSLARAAGAGGVLKNTGVNFETSALTLFPKLDDTGHDSWGGALGVEYLFDLRERRQVVFEIAGLHPFGDDATAPGDEIGLGARYQMALDNSWILRFDAIAATIESADDLLGFAVELRKKF